MSAKNALSKSQQIFPRLIAIFVVILEILCIVAMFTLFNTQRASMVITHGEFETIYGAITYLPFVIRALCVAAAPHKYQSAPDGIMDIVISAIFWTDWVSLLICGILVVYDAEKYTMSSFTSVQKLCIIVLLVIWAVVNAIFTYRTILHIRK